MFCRYCGAVVNESDPFCTHCGKPVSEVASNPAKTADGPQSVSFPPMSPTAVPVCSICVNYQVGIVKEKSGAENLRLVVGIVSIVLFVVTFLQSCTTSCAAAFNETFTAGGYAGLAVSVFLLVSGILSVAARRSKGGTITAIVFYVLAGFVGLGAAGIIKYLVFWAVIALIFAALELISLLVEKKRSIQTIRR